MNTPSMSTHISFATQSFATNGAVSLAGVNLEVGDQRGLMLEHFATGWTLVLGLMVFEREPG